jgi:hypothetical protein
MPLDWSGMVFVQRWRGAVARGLLVGIRRPRDRTYLDIRVHGAELSVGSTQHAVDAELLDLGDIARERRLAILDRVSVVIEARVESVETPLGAVKSHPIGSQRAAGAPRDTLRPGTRVSGLAGDSDGGRSFVLDIGFPIVVTLPEEAPIPSSGTGVSFAAPNELRGYLVVG